MLFKIVISYPPLRGPGSPMLTQNRQFQWYHAPSYIYPLVPAMAATLLKEAGFQVIWNDCIAQNWTYEQFLEFIRKEKPDLIAFETKTPVIKQHWKIINELKTYDLRLTTVLFGDHVTALPEESLQNSQVDFVLTGGDYDFLLLNLCKSLDAQRRAQNSQPILESGIYYRDNGQINPSTRLRIDGEHSRTIKNTGPFQLNHDLNSLPFIDRGLTKAHLYGEKWKKYTPFFYTQAGRDCWWNKCSFCVWTALYPHFRCRSPENLLDELGFLIERYSAREIFDDTGTFPAGAWLEEFCQGMIKRGYHKKIIFSCNMNFIGIDEKLARLMKRANFRKLKMGLESANQKTLDKINKGTSAAGLIDKCKMISKCGLGVHLTIMLGYPWETKAEALNTVRLADTLMKNGWIEMLQATVLVPYPGTQLYQQGLENNWFRFPAKDYERFDMSEPVFKAQGMSPEELMGLCRKTYKTFLSGKFILRNLIKVRSLADFSYDLKGLSAALAHIKDFRR